ncbi:hypothetical protein M0805_007573 [Coniferiporia weirii]|nr:hypothetical protein M0805_007573 [Coniferiporia weirii]
MSAESPSRSLTLRVLEVYHPCVSTLLAYLEDNIDSTSLLGAQSSSSHLMLSDISSSAVCDHLLKDDDAPTYRDLMTKAFVAAEAAAAPHAKHSARRAKLKIIAPSMSMNELVERAQARLFARKGKPSNMITAGYRSAEFRSETGIGGGPRQGITNYFVNTIVDAIQAPEWNQLLSRVGETVLLHLLTETSIYVPLPNDCYCQLTGTPLIYVAPPKERLAVEPVGPGRSVNEKPQKRKSEAGEELHQKRAAKRRRRKHPVNEEYMVPVPLVREENSTKPKSRAATDIPFARTSLFYGRPCRQAKTGRILLGLPSDHVLNRMELTSWRESKGLVESKNKEGKLDMRPGDRNGAPEARHLSKYMFPLQYDLGNAFFVAPEKVREEQFERRRFAIREAEIELKGASKTPVRLKNALPLLGQLFHRHSKCGYKPLLDKICPSKLKPDLRDSTVDSSVILDLISEEISEVRLQTQMDLDRSTQPTISDFTSLSILGGNRRLSLLRTSQTKYKPKFAEFTCSYAEVFLYVRAVSKVVVPYALWGCERNRKTILLHVKQLISGRRYEGMTLHNVIQGVSTSECDWLLPHGRPNPNQQLNQSMAEMLKKRELLEEFLFWYFDSFLIPLLRTTFYVTESSAFRNRVLYFRQDDWDVLCQPLLDRLAATTFQRIHQHEAEALLQQRKLGYSFVRLLPKDSGVRPIVNLRRKRKSDNPSEQSQSINQILAAAFHILTYEKSMQKEQLGASVFGPDETYLLLKNFKKKVVGGSGKMPKLYFVKVDVQACFDTIEQDKLLGILKALISEDAYMVQKYGQIIPTFGKAKRTYIRKALPEYEHPHFLTHAAQLAALLRHAILVDQVVYPFAFREDVMQLLEDHITSNIVKIGQDYYRQRVGIPQGSVLSSLLCSFFYGDLERTVLRFVLESQNNVLLRLIDDYLFITTDEADARRFLETMNKGHPDYGCFIAKDKTLTNFDHNVGTISQLGLSTVLHPDQKLFPWCGYLINTEDLSIMADYSRFHDTYLSDSLTVERGKRPNAAFVQKMLQTAKAKSHAIFTDTLHNSERAARTNVHQAFVLAAMKMHAYVRAAGRGLVGRGTNGLAFVPNPAEKRKGKRKVGVKKETSASGAFLLSTIRQSIRYTYSSIRTKVAGRVAQQAGARCSLSRNEIIWLGTHAYHSVLTLKRTAYAHAGVLGALAADLAHPHYGTVRKRLGRIARESLDAMLRDIRF